MSRHKEMASLGVRHIFILDYPRKGQRGTGGVADKPALVIRQENRRAKKYLMNHHGCLSRLSLLRNKSLIYYRNFGEVQAGQGFPPISWRPLLFPQRAFREESW
jgi:hypothetical protein